MLRHYLFNSALIGALVFLTCGLYFVLRPYLHGKSSLDSGQQLPWYAALATTCLLLYGFILHFGNRQFGGFDFSVMVDTGWRLARGQHPYADFLCTLPPGFMLGAKYAFLIWGPTWDAQLHLTAVFACCTFVWFYFLLAAILRTKPAALLTAICLECISIVVAAYWWYNPIASVSGGIFLLSCVLYLVRPRSVLPQISFAASLFLLGMMKPNTAAPLIAGALLILLAPVHARVRTVILTVLSLVALSGFLFLNHISVGQLIQSYRSVAVSRGLGNLEGLKNGVPQENLIISTAFICALLTPFLLWWRSVIVCCARREYSCVRLYLLLGLGPIVGTMAILTNGEYKFTDMVLFVIPGMILLFGKSEFGTLHLSSQSALQAFYVSVVCALTAVTIYTGVKRLRVYSIGPFVQLGTSEAAGNPFFPNLRTGPEFVSVLRDVRNVLSTRPAGPIFFGPRMEFAYAAFGLESPKNLPIWWHPGTSFGRGQQRSVLAEWEKHRFGTLIFFKDDFTYYVPEYLALLDTMYVKDQRYPELTVLRLK